MPCIIKGPVIIKNNSGTVVQCAHTISPISASKTVSGSGGGNTGAFMIVNNFISITIKCK
ncbi:spore germination protein [Guptibacillus algicola]|uniref:spore germination protein n=1 Tax=Guptibacillus algicola TaxID=225844 RepID=UPI001CD81020|nr:spore germination protein [Alkalihalobacillus algicola]MCA0989286.1 spore germination protein [Alkalihalobacillus algicola]